MSIVRRRRKAGERAIAREGEYKSLRSTALARDRSQIRRNEPRNEGYVGDDITLEVEAVAAAATPEVDIPDGPLSILVWRSEPTQVLAERWRL